MIDGEALELLDGLVAKARKMGAEAADAVFVESRTLHLSQRLGQREHVERSESADIGLRVLMGRRQAMVSSSDTSVDALDELAGRAVAMAGCVPEDPYCGLADPDQLATVFPDIDGLDPAEPDPDRLAEMAALAEAAALGVEGVTNSEGASASWGQSRFAMLGSNGFARAHVLTRHGISVAVLAGRGTDMETDHDYSSAVHAEDLKSPEDVGRSAGERAVARLNSRKVGTAVVPLVYDPRVANSLIGHFAAAINGSSVARGTSFLKGSMGQQLFAPGINIIDDPHRRRGLKSRPFDGEGLPTARRRLVENGELKSWLLDLRSARQLGLGSTGNAVRGTSSPPSPAASNLYLEAGNLSPAQLMRDIKSGLYVTEMMGSGVNMVTGDYSRGARGFWIEGGEIAFPVSEITIAGNLIDMFANLTPADDLEFRLGTDAPTVRIDGMTVAGR